MDLIDTPEKYDILTVSKQAYFLMCQAKAMSEFFDSRKDIAQYVHSTSRGHEAIQLAVGLQTTKSDFLSPYYRDDAMLLGVGFTPYQLMLQLLAKKDDPFSAGRNYYSHPAINSGQAPKIMMQSSSTGMQAIPAVGAAMGIAYLKQQGLQKNADGQAISICSLGDGAFTEGEVSEALQMAVLKKLPVLFIVQDNGWSISATTEEISAQDAGYFARGLKGLETRVLDGTDFQLCYETLHEVIALVREECRPFLIHAKVPLLSHHTSGVRAEWYRDDLDSAVQNDPVALLFQTLIDQGLSEAELNMLAQEAKKLILADFERAAAAKDPDPATVTDHIFADTPVLKEIGERSPKLDEVAFMVDSAISAMREILATHPESLFFGLDVGSRLGGVFREGATLASQFGDNRVFNMPIQEAFIIGSTVGLSAAGCKPIVSIPYAEFIWPGLNQLFAEVSRSCYLSAGQWPVSCVIRVGVGSYGNGGPYHSSGIESVLTNIHGIKIVYPSNGADLKGLLKAAYYDPNPVIVLEHKGLYWSKLKNTANARSVIPDEQYILPIGKANTVLTADQHTREPTLSIITYGAAVHWAMFAAQQFAGRIEIIDLRTLAPLDEDLIYASVKRHGRCLVLTEEPEGNCFAQALAGKIQRNCFRYLDAPVDVLGALNVPALPISSVLEDAVLPCTAQIKQAIQHLLSW